MRRCLVLVLLVLAGCSTAHHRAAKPEPVSTRLFTGAGASFSYPTTWRPTFPTCVTPRPAGGPESLVYLSTQPLDVPPLGIGIGCGNPIRTLRPRGTFVSWWTARPVPAVGSSDFITPPATSLDVNGRAVKEQRDHAKECLRVSGTISVVAELDAGLDVYGFDACIRGPDVAASEAKVQAMLHSVHVSAVELPRSTTTNRVTLPGVVGMELHRAETVLEQRGLHGLLEQVGIYSRTVPRGVVIEEDPAAGSTVMAGSSVTLLESGGDGR